MIRWLGSYTESSSSGRGVHVVVKSEKPGPRRKDAARGVGIYGRARFMVVTDDRFPGTPATVEERQRELYNLYVEVFGEPETAPDDARVPRDGGRGDNGEVSEGEEGCKVRAAVVAGDTSDYAGDHSAADQALVSILAFYTQDREQVDCLFRRSGLVREKWTEREDYRRRTIDKARRPDRDYYGAERDFSGVVMIDDEDLGGDAGSGEPEGNPSATVTLPPGVVCPPKPSGSGFPMHAFCPS